MDERKKGTGAPRWRRSARAAGEPFAQLRELRGQRLQFGNGALAALQHAMRDRFGPAAQGPAGGREGDAHAPLVLRIATAGDEPGGFHALEQRGQRARVQAQPFAQLGHRDAVLLPEGEHGDVLRIGEPDGIEQWLVELGHRQRRRIQGEADLAVQPLEGGERGRGWDGAGRHGLNYCC